MVDDDIDIMDCQQHVAVENNTTASAAAGDAPPLPSSRHHGNQTIQDHQLLDTDGSFIPLDPADDNDGDDDAEMDSDDDDEMVHDHRRPRLDLIGVGQRIAAQLLHLHLRGVVSLTHVDTTLLALDGGGYANGGFGAVPASAAAIADLRKREFRGGSRDAAAAGCRICLEELEDGEEVSVVPCSRGHEFHTHCIAKWFGVSNMCPLCRHRLPTAPDG